MQFLRYKVVQIAVLLTLFLSGFVYADEGGSPVSATLTNPLKFGTIDEFLTALLGILVQIMVPITTVMIIYSGFLFVKARGNPTELQAARSSFLWTVVGAAVLLGAFVIKTAIQATVAQFGATP